MASCLINYFGPKVAFRITGEMAILRQPPACALPELALDYNALREAT